MTKPYNPGKQFFLSMRVPLSRYFGLAKRQPNEQVDPKKVQELLLLTPEKAHEFVTKTQAIREHYAQIKPKTTWTQHGSVFLGTRYRIERPDFSGIEVRDLELTNVFFMRDLGLITTNAARTLAQELKEQNYAPANLNLPSYQQLARINLRSGSGEVTITGIEIDKIIRSLGVEPETDIIKTLGLSFRNALRLVSYELLQSGFHPTTIDSLCGQTSTRKTLQKAKKVLRSKLSRSIIELVL